MNIEDKKIERLYALLERSEKERDVEGVAALRWAIFELERTPDLKQNPEPRTSQTR